MVFAYVSLHHTIEGTDWTKNGTRIYALLLPHSQTNTWDEVEVRASKMVGAGFGVFPRSVKGSGAGRDRDAALRWSDLRHPVLFLL